MGSSGDDYDSTMYYSKFSGTFKNPQKINSYTYSFELENIEYENEPDTEEIVNQDNSDYRTRMIYTEAYGLDNGTKTIYAYTESAPMPMLPEGFITWIEHLRDDDNKSSTELSYKCLYTVESEYGWIGSSEQ